MPDGKGEFGPEVSEGALGFIKTLALAAGVSEELAGDLVEQARSIGKMGNKKAEEAEALAEADVTYVEDMSGVKIEEGRNPLVDALSNFYTSPEK